MIRHYYNFNHNINWKRLSLDEWEMLRNGASENAFSIEKNLNDYILNCNKKTEYKYHADIIYSIFKDHNVDKTISFGCGKGILEYFLNQNMEVIYSDFTPNGLNKIKDLFPEIQIYCHNLMEKLDLNEVHNVKSAVMYRLSTEFSKSDHKIIFKNLYISGIQYIVYVPTDILNIQIFITENKNHLYNKIHRVKDTFCGYIYSERELIKMWEDYYNVEEKVKVENNNYIYFLKSRLL